MRLKAFLTATLFLFAFAAFAEPPQPQVLYQTPDGSKVLLVPTAGKAFFVQSTATTAAATNSGRTPSMPLTTLALAVAKCTASAGDVIYVLPGHTESVSATALLSIDKAGVAIIGIGSGSLRPTITLATSVDATVSIDAASVLIKNLVFTCSKDIVKVVLDVNKADCTIEDCEFREGAAAQPLVWIDVTGAGANACDRTTIRNCKITSIAAGPNGGIELGEISDNTLITGCLIDGDFADAGIHNPTGKILTNLVISGNTVRNRNSGDHAIELVSACTGLAVNNRLAGDTIGAILDPGSLFCLGNLASPGIDVAGVPIPVAAAAAAPADSIDATAIKDAAIDAATFAANAIANAGIADNAISAGKIAAAALSAAKFDTDVATSFWVTKTLTSSNVKKDSQVDITGVSSGGALALTDVIMQTNATGLAAGTNFQIKANNSSGAVLVLVTTVASLGAQASMDMAGANVSKYHAVLETGKKLTADCTVADCTGAGTLTIYMKFERLATAATIAAAP